MLFSIFSLSSLAALVAASPTFSFESCSGSCSPPTLPVHGGGQELPLPEDGSSLKYILLGFGIQNYTCESTESTANAIGALAMLYDITALYPGQSCRALPIEEFNKLTSWILHSTNVPLNLQQPPWLGADPLDPFITPGEDLQLDGLDDPIPFVGHHFFNSRKVPQFQVEGAQGEVNFLASKLDSIAAPSSADAGADGTGAVDWLYLGASEGTIGGSFLYRVITAGGKSHGCSSGNAVDSTSYTTQYWIYA